MAISWVKGRPYAAIMKKLRGAPSGMPDAVKEKCRRLPRPYAAAAAAALM